MGHLSTEQFLYNTTMTQALYEHTHEGLVVLTGLSSPWVVCSYSGITVLSLSRITINTNMFVYLMTSFEGSTMHPWGQALAQQLPSSSGQGYLPL